MNFSRYELAGFLGIALLMLVAVWAIKLESNLAFLSLSTQQQAASVGATVVGEGQDRVSAVSQAVDQRGRVQQLIIEDVLTGAGREVTTGDRVTVHYVGRLRNGQEFDNSRDRGQPFSFTVGQGRVIAGWEEGILGMREGGSRILVIPPEQAYGARGAGQIPPNATLIFAIDLLEIE